MLRPAPGHVKIPWCWRQPRRLCLCYGRTRASVLKPTSCWRRSTAGSPRALTLRIVRRANALLATMGAGERESIAIARARGGIVLSNEPPVAHHGRTHGVPCVRLPDILRALWDAVYTVHPPGHLRRVKPLPAGAGDASASTDSLPQVIALPALVIVPLHGDVQQLL